MSNQIYIISVDWFQVTCSRATHQILAPGFVKQSRIPNDEGKHFLYELEDAREFNPMFQHSLMVTLHGFPLATIYYEPRPSTMKKTMCIMKLANPLLYSGNWLWYVQSVLSALDWKFENISRVDLCADFNTFANDLHPTEFIRRYLRSGELSSAEPSYYRVGSNRFATIGRKRYRSENVRGLLKNSSEIVAEYLRFGTRSTGCCVYLYNKTKELDERGGKKYIRNLWAEIGLQDDEEHPVFRLEFSINSSAMSVKRKRTDEEKGERRDASNLFNSWKEGFVIDKISFDDFATQRSIESLFWAFCNHFFKFRVMAHQDYPHRWPTLSLFDARLDTDIKPYSISRNVDSGRAERNAANCLNRILWLCGDLSLCEQTSISNAINVLERLSEAKVKQIGLGEVQKVLCALNEGHGWEEIKKMRITDCGRLEQLKLFVRSELYKELRNVLGMHDVQNALLEYEATEEILREDYELTKDWDPNNE